MHDATDYVRAELAAAGPRGLTLRELVTCAPRALRDVDMILEALARLDHEAAVELVVCDQERPHRFRAPLGEFALAGV